MGSAGIQAFGVECIIMKPSLLTIGYSRPGYGFGRVLNELETVFTHHFSVTHLDLAGATRHVNAGASPSPQLAVEDVQRAIAQLAPQYIFILADLEFVANLAVKLPPKPTHVVAYVPVDSPIEPFPELENISRLDVLVLYNNFGRNSILKAMQEINHAVPRIEIVPHGMDTGKFFPIDSDPAVARDHARTALFGADHRRRESFIVLNANRNQPRKRVDLTLRAFRKFIDLVPDANAYLYLHMGLRDQGILVLPLAGELGLADKLLMPEFTLTHPESTDEHLNLVYNACDIGLNTADAEGWGLISFEHASARKAQIVPAHTGCGEVWSDHGWLIDSTSYRDHMLNRQAYEVDVTAIAEALARLYLSPQLRARYDELAYRHATINTWSWKAVGERLSDLICEGAHRGSSPWMSAAETYLQT